MFLISMTEFFEAVTYAIYCVGLEGLHTSLKLEEPLIYLYDGIMVELSSQAAVGKRHRLAIACMEPSTNVRPSESLFWLQTSERNRALKCFTYSGTSINDHLRRATTLYKTAKNSGSD